MSTNWKTYLTIAIAFVVLMNAYNRFPAFRKVAGGPG